MSDSKARQQGPSGNNVFENIQSLAAAAMQQQPSASSQPQVTSHSDHDVWTILQQSNSSNDAAAAANSGAFSSTPFQTWNQYPQLGRTLQAQQSAAYSQFLQYPTSTNDLNQRLVSDDFSASLYSTAHPGVVRPHTGNASTPVHKENSRDSSPMTSAAATDVNAGVRYINGDNVASKSLFRARASIPMNISIEEYERQGIEAAIASRLPSHSLHPSEEQLLKDYTTNADIVVYIGLRNSMLRLWLKNPMIAVTKYEAVGVAREDRYLELAGKCYEWLVRNGYINFGCLNLQINPLSTTESTTRRKTVVIVGAGMAGLGCARQLDGLFQQFAEKFEQPPQIIVLEGRGRVGGRIYSYPLQSKTSSALSEVAAYPSDLPSAVDLGAYVVTGFDHGNPMSVLVRRQLALHYHTLRHHTDIYDIDGTPVDKTTDIRAENLFNDIVDRASVFKQRRSMAQNNEFIKGGITVETLETSEAMGTNMIPMLSANVDKVTGKPTAADGASASVSMEDTVSRLGFECNLNAQSAPPFDPSDILQTQFPSLGDTMDKCLSQYQQLAHLSPLDLRLLNWHYANLEYANATNLSNLSLKHWDQDDGNEFRGAHSTIIGGYHQVIKGLALAPRKLDIRLNHTITKISYKESTPPDSSPPSVQIICENGETVAADAVVITVPLGVLKSKSIDFDPRLPNWKADAIQSLGFGLLNKLVLVFDEVFWDTNTDLVGLLRMPLGNETEQQNYSSNRGQFYMFWNCVATTGKPVLIALMAGDAARNSEVTSDDDLITEAVTALSRMYPEKRPIPQPIESIITRWSRDKFSRGSYSFVAKHATGEDYDFLAKPISNKVFFAGEATCRTHPATVHGAYISGLRAASEVLEKLIGQIQMPIDHPLIPEKTQVEPPQIAGIKRKHGLDTNYRAQAHAMKKARLEKRDEWLNQQIVTRFGPKPVAPVKGATNPFLIFQKECWVEVKEKAETERIQVTGDKDFKLSRDEVRAKLGQTWRGMPEENKHPFKIRAIANKATNTDQMTTYKTSLARWEADVDNYRKTLNDAMEEQGVPPEEQEIARLAELEERLEAQIREEQRRQRAMTMRGIDEDSNSDSSEYQEDQEDGTYK
ncbi:Lysine-specific histone demethylase 1A [Neolecta irregularis DAH-3]|uniref:Lysine-specific histone demethylase 1A n=1 Tax=Neolecta irregularis (strain DAH-3) TaxID=1198029 RepID=A0A1U7LH17_NEOID|nr:Lysine-specific histone demethylase 1A [Neolecta irregularis DAH-3]|eukprot:OLL21842.1 Lysine-specific histone demethylase 1A [Neolecta irregularis DAH-3]